MDSIISKKQKIPHNRNNTNVSDIFIAEKDKNIYHVGQLGKVYDVESLDETDCTEFSETKFVHDNVYDVLPTINQEQYTFATDSRDNVYEEEKIINEYSAETQETFDDDGIFNTHDLDFYEDDGPSTSTRFSLMDLSIFSQSSVLLPQRVTTRFAFFAAIITIALGSFLFVGTSVAVKDRVDGAGKRAIESIEDAVASLGAGDFISSGDSLADAHQEFLFASEEINKINNFATFISQFVPGASKLSSGNHIIEAGKYLTHSATELHAVIPVVISEDSDLVSADGTHVSFLALYKMLADRMKVASGDITLAREHIDKVHLDDVPTEHRNLFVQMKDTLPLIEKSLINAVAARSVVEDLLGANGKQTYLFLFQNNHEMRATGGFIGSYGILEIRDGKIQKMVVDDIYNQDGQLIDRVVPPLPIQKVSADWSLHDSNWFVDFPLSAKKAMDFYERTGGPTVDGVIAITPAMMQKFLTITGPIALPEHNVILTNNNFMELLQSEVEERGNYIAGKVQENDIVEEKEEEVEEVEQKQPKKILSDLMPIIIDKLSDRKNPENLAKVLSAVSSGFKERHMMIYMSDGATQDIIESNGWSGSILQTDKDYLSIINTNVNGFKTDGIVDEYITHSADIDVSGQVVNTVSIRRVHRGGKTGFPWWDAVNSNYMRVYVPQGSELLSVEGQTREINEERLDYDALGYERDRDVEQEENNMYIDEETGTRIYDEYNKTVFANWVYVSPQESVTITYEYRLPFRVDFDSDRDGKFGSYAVLFQKQAGSEKSHIKSEIMLDEDFTQVWHSHNKDDATMENELMIDRYHGMVFRIN